MATTDDRTRRQKLVAMATQLASPAEAEVARAKLESMPAPRTLSRADILAQPDVRAGVGSRRIYDRYLHVSVILDEDDPAFDSDWDLD